MEAFGQQVDINVKSAGAEERDGLYEHHPTGGPQLSNHRGSCDADVASLPFS